MIGSVHPMVPWWPERGIASSGIACLGPKEGAEPWEVWLEYNYCSTHSGPICFIVEGLLESHRSRDNIDASESTVSKLVFVGFARAGKRRWCLLGRRCSRVLRPGERNHPPAEIPSPQNWPFLASWGWGDSWSPGGSHQLRAQGDGWSRCSCLPVRGGSQPRDRQGW